MTVDGWWNTALKDPYEESRLEICRGCNGEIDGSDESETDEEAERALEKKLEENRQEREAAIAKAKLEDRREETLANKDVRALGNHATR